MALPPYTQAQYDALVAAIAEGARIVKYEDRETTYRSLDEMNRLRLHMEKALGLSSGGPHRKRMAHDKGLGGSPTAPSSWGSNC